MTKKHFIALADMLKADKPVPGSAHAYVEPTMDYQCRLREWQRSINRLADYCEEQNPRFNRSRWLAYIKGECGKNGGKVK